MKDKIIGSNLLILLIYTLWINLSANEGLGVLIANAIIIIIHCLILLTLSAMKEYRKSFLMSLLLVISVGFGSCFISSNIKDSQHSKHEKLKNCNVNTRSNYKGTITDLQKYDQTINIDITPDGSREVVYNYYYYNQTDGGIGDFACKGCRVNKKADSSTFTITDSTGKKKNFIVPDCQ